MHRDIIKFGIFSKIWEGRCANLGKYKKCQNYIFLDIFCHTSDKRKGNLDRERVKRGLLCFQVKTETIASDLPRK